MGLAPNKDALLHVLSKKANMEYESFLSATQSVYMLQYMDREKVGPGDQRANVTVWGREASAVWGRGNVCVVWGQETRAWDKFFKYATLWRM